MTNISPKKLEANRRHSRKSTRPTSARAKSRARFNALKHGATAQTPVLSGEDPALFQARVDAYQADLQPRDTLESEMVERMAVMSTVWRESGCAAKPWRAIGSCTATLPQSSRSAKKARPGNATPSSRWTPRTRRLSAGPAISFKSNPILGTCSA
jgi:hypothetical protein